MRISAPACWTGARARRLAAGKTTWAALSNSSLAKSWRGISSRRMTTALQEGAETAPTRPPEKLHVAAQWNAISDWK
jgi:hypothetical protein